MATLPQWIEARVIQKIATEAEWNEITLVPYKGEVCLVGDSGGKVVNIKIGDGINTFPNLEYMFDSIQQNVGYIAIESNALPTPLGDVAWGMVTEGTYTFGGSDVFTVPDGHWGIANYSSGVWSFVDMGELPQVEGVDTLNPEGENLPKEKAVADYTAPYFNNFVVGKNKADKSEIVQKRWLDDGRWIDATTHISYPIFSVDGIPSLAISGVRNNSSAEVRAVYFDSNGDVVSVIQGNGTTQAILTTPIGAVSVGINVAQDTSIVDPTDNVYANSFQIEIGDTVTSYEPYSIKLSAENIVGNLPYAPISEFTPVKNSVNYWSSDIKNMVDVSAASSGYFQTNGNPANNASWKRLMIKVNPLTKYSISGNTSSFFGNEYATNVANSTNLVKNITKTGTSATFITDANTQYIGLNWNINDDNTIMMNEGDVIPYVAYGEKLIDAGKIYPPISNNSSVDVDTIEVVKTETNFDIYIHQYDDIYLRQRYSRYTRAYIADTVSFYDVWKLGELAKCVKIGDYNYSIGSVIVSHSTEWETALHIDGHHISGQQHGYEQKVRNIFLVDGVAIEEGFVGNFKCKKLEFFQYSQLYKFNTTTNPILDKFCRWEIDINSITVDIPKLTALEEVVITNRAYIGMMANSLTEVTNGFNDVSYYDNVLTSPETDPNITVGEANNNPNTRVIWSYGSEYSVKFNVLSMGEEFSNHKLYVHNNGKIYNVYTSLYTMPEGKNFSVKWKIEYKLKKTI